MANVGVRMFGCASCCEGENCTLHEDDFTADNLSTDYTTVSGTWSVSSGELRTSSSAAVLVTQESFPSGLTAAYASVVFRAGSRNTKGGIILGYVDSNNYWYAELTTVQPNPSDPFGGTLPGSLKLYERAGGTTTERDAVALPTFDANTQATLFLCITPTLVLASVATLTSETVGYAPASAPTVVGTKAGLIAGSSDNSAIFDDFLMSKHKIDDATCPSCQTFLECASCSGDVPLQMQVEISNIVNGSSCSDCDEFNGLFVVTYNFAESTAISCRWEYEPDVPICGATKLRVSLASGVMNVVWLDSSNSPVITFGSPVAGPGPHDCTAFSNETADFSDSPGGDCQSVPASINHVKVSSL